MADRFTIGIDFGTESARAVLVDVATGEEVASAVHRYEHGVMDQVLPDGRTRLPPDFALQHPADYLNAVENTVRGVLSASGVAPEQVIGVGIDFTACTMLPVYADGTPLCTDPEFASEPHAYVKLWKHHAAQPQANRINELGAARGESFLRRYGGRYSSEWFFAKLLETLEAAPRVYTAAGRFLEAADWVVWQLTGRESRNACTAGYKAMWDKREGFPGEEFFAALDPRLTKVVDQKMSRDISYAGQRVGVLTPEMAARTGLPAGIAVASANVDAHVAVPAATVVEAGKLVMVMGTSICHMVLGTEQRFVEGMCGVVEDGILPGYYGYEAGQSAVGDIFAWFVRNAVPPEYHAEAAARGVDVYAVLEERAAKLAPGEHGLLALDWWNGNRSVLVDADLTGLILGLNLSTTAEEIYRALIEATAFGTATIIDAFERGGVPVRELYACGGLPNRSRLLMQVYADVTGKEIRVAASAQTPALGSAMFAAVAAGADRGGYDSIVTASRQMAHLLPTVYLPDAQSHETYRLLWREYLRLHDHFGRGANDVMKTLKRIKAAVRGNR